MAASTAHDRLKTSATDGERRRLAEVGRRLAKARTIEAQLVVNGKKIDLPETLVDLLAQAAQVMARGETATLVPSHRYVTTQRAAELLGMSRQYIVRLLDRGEIPFTKVGAHRRVLAADVFGYEQRRDAATRAALNELATLSEDLGLYESTAALPPTWRRLAETESTRHLSPAKPAGRRGGSR